MHYVGLDIGGTATKAALTDGTARILETRKILTITDDLTGLVSSLAELVHEFQKTAVIDAIGLGVPGLRSSKTHIIETSPNIPCLQNVNLEQLLADQVHIRTVGENDANAAVYAEFVRGAAMGLEHIACLTLGTGLGSGFVLNGSLFTGASGFGGEFGHTVIQAGSSVENSGRLCGCGNRGCLETYVSASGIVMTAEAMMELVPDSLLHGIELPLTSEKIYNAATQGDATAEAVFKETGRYLGIACANLIDLMNLEMIVIGGGVMAAGEMLMQSVRAAARRYAFPASFRDCQIVQSQLWPDGGVIGAAMIARDR